MTTSTELDKLDFLAAIEQTRCDIALWDRFFQHAKDHLEELNPEQLELLIALAKQKTAEVKLVSDFCDVAELAVSGTEIGSA